MTDTTAQIIENYKFSCCDSILPKKDGNATTNSEFIQLNYF